MAIRPFRTGDDLALNEVFHDPRTPAEHVVRNLFRADAEDPVTRCVVATLPDSEVVIGAAALAESPAHPTRAWVHVEVAEFERGRGVGRELFAAVRETATGSGIEDLPLRARVDAGSVGEDVALRAGFAPLFTTRVVEVDALALGGLGADRVEDLEVTATGSVVLTQAFGEWYAGVNEADPAETMSVGRVNARFLSEASGAYGAAMLKRGGEVSAFAVSYAQPEDAEADTELTLGTLYDARTASADVDLQSSAFQEALEDAGCLLARLSTERSVVLEVTSEMPVMTELVDGLLEAGKARLKYTYVTLGDD